jgi:AraC-like DNA-binding protein
LTLKTSCTIPRGKPTATRLVIVAAQYSASNSNPSGRPGCGNTNCSSEESLILPRRLVSWLAWRAYQAFTDSDHRSTLLLEATAIELLYQLPWKHSAQAESGTPRWLKDVLEILHAEFCRPFSLTTIAQRVGAHPVHLARAFQRCHRMTVGQYVRRLRVNYAMNALAGEDSLSDIARARRVLRPEPSGACL